MGMTTNSLVVSSPSAPLTVSDAMGDTRTLNTIDLAALASLLKSSNSEIQPGLYRTSGTLRWDATVEKLPDEESVKALGFDYTAAFLLLANHVNHSTLASVLEELASHHKSGTKPDTKNMKDWVASKWDAFGITIGGTRSGKTLVKGSVRVN
jgi:hypothetical protein